MTCNIIQSTYYHNGAEPVKDGHWWTSSEKSVSKEHNKVDNWQSLARKLNRLFSIETEIIKAIIMALETMVNWLYREKLKESASKRRITRDGCISGNITNTHKNIISSWFMIHLVKRSCRRNSEFKKQGKNFKNVKKYVKKQAKLIDKTVCDLRTQVVAEKC